jgi:hypothetical protein
VKRASCRSQISGLSTSLVLGIVLGGALGCATKFPFQPSISSPAAKGYVNADLDDNGNSRAEIHLQYLALPPTLTPPRSIYVVWAESQFGRQVLLGQIKVEKDRSANWEGTVPFDKFRILVTAEDIAWPERPREPYVIQTDFFEPDSF